MILNDLTLILCTFITVGGSIWATKITRKVKEVHILVNNQLETVMDKNVQLTADLKQAKTEPAEEG